MNDTISGEGLIGTGHGMSYINSSTVVDANVSGQTLNFDLNGGTITNDNLLEAANGGTLLFSSRTGGNSGATIKASGTGSQVVLNTTTVQGGTLTGPLVAENGSLLDGTTSDGITTNNLTISDGSTVSIAGTVHNTGTVTLQGTGDQTALYAGNSSSALATVVSYFGVWTGIGAQ